MLLVEYIRLRAISRMVKRSYNHIWDCCCDHGFLGMMLLEQHDKAQVHFVDAVEELTQALSVCLQEKYSHQPQLSLRYHVLCDDVAELPLANCSPSDTQLIIIAGVGGDLVAKLVRDLCTKHPNQSLEFILCPVYHTHKVRAALIQHGLGLLAEQIVAEKGRFYEVIHVATHSHTEVGLVGNDMWDFSQPESQQYLKQLIQHYQRVSLAGDPDILALVKCYERLALEQEDVVFS